jgi:hypothetical protein
VLRDYVASTGYPELHIRFFHAYVDYTTSESAIQVVPNRLCVKTLSKEANF